MSLHVELTRLPFDQSATPKYDMYFTFNKLSYLASLAWLNTRASAFKVSVCAYHQLSNNGIQIEAKTTCAANARPA